MKIDVRHNIDTVQASLRAVPAKAAEGAAIKALNRTITSVRAEAARTLKKQYGSLPIRILKAMMRFLKARRGSPTAKLTFSNKRIPLIRWGAIQTPGGVKVKGPARVETFAGDEIVATYGADIMNHAFIQRSRRGVTHVWIRDGSKRYPITGLVAPSLARQFVETAIQQVLVASAEAKFALHYERELRYALSRS